MPIYEFHCHDCQRDSEVLVRSTKIRKTRCPQCGSTRTQKKLSVFATGSNQPDPVAPCSGNPNSCGRCSFSA